MTFTGVDFFWTDMYPSHVTDVTFWGRKSLRTGCIIDYSFISGRTLDFLISFPYYTLLVLIWLNFFQNSNQPDLFNKKHLSNINMLALLLFLVETSHCTGHLLHFSYCDELTIFLYVIYNFTINYIVLCSVRCRPLFLFFKNTIGMTGFYAVYFVSVLILLSVYHYGGYLCASFCQCIMQWASSLVWDNINYPNRDDWKIRKTLYAWNIWFTIGYVVMATEILRCDWLLSEVLNVPWHIIADFLFQVANYCHLNFFLLANNPYLVQFDDAPSMMKKT